MTHAGSQPLKAYIAHDGDEQWSVIYETNGAVARRQAASEFDQDFAEVESCRRAPSLDEYGSTDRIPVAAMLDLGWRFECNGCGRRIDTDGSDDCVYEEPSAWDRCDARGFYLDEEEAIPDHASPFTAATREELDPVGFYSTSVYCTPACRDQDERRTALVKMLQSYAEADLRRRTAAAYPFATLTGSSSYVDRTTLRLIGCQADFALPGSIKYGGGHVSFSIYSISGYGLHLGTFVCNGDLELFERLCREHGCTTNDFKTRP